MIIQNYLVSYTEDDGGIQTTEKQVFETLEEAEACFNKLIEEEAEDIFLCQILKIN